MTLWLVLAAMTGAAVMSVLWPLSRRAVSGSPIAPETAFYRDQIADIARDEARGLLASEEADGARAEAGRRLLRAGAVSGWAAAGSTGEPALRRRRAASAIGLSVVPLVALALYGAMGSPDLPASPVSSRAGADAGRLDVDAALARIEQHLSANPADVRGWDLIGPIYLRLRRFAEAEKAYAAAIRIAGPSLERTIGRGEALFGVGGGVMTAEAREAFERGLSFDRASPKAHFYLALAAEQDGDADGAVRHYEAILAGVAADSPWRNLVGERMAALGAAPDSSGSLGPAGGPVPAQIRAMVDGLDSRLVAQGGTEEEWERLIRSYMVLGERDKAEAALARARKALDAGDGAASRIADAARAFGLDPDRSAADRPSP